jgi:integrase
MAVLVREKVKGSGEWWVFINHNNKRRSKKVGDKKAANAVKREVEARLAKGELGMLKEKCPTVAKYGLEWLDSPLREWTDSTRSNHSGVFELHIKPALGSKRLDEVRRKDVKALISEVRSKGLSSSRAQVVLAVLSGLFESALEDEMVSANPCQNAGKHCGNETVVEISPLTAEEVQSLLDNASKLSFETYAFFLVAVRTGLRAGELLALEWSDIDFENRFVEVKKAMSVATKQIGPPKNKKTRKVDLTLAVVQALRRLQVQRRVVSIGGNDLVFPNLNYQILIKKTVKEIAHRPIRIHDLRHTYATLRIAKGDNIMDVSKQLGHHRVAFTLDQYGHWMPGEHKSQVDELDNLHLSAPHTHPGAAKPHG